MKAYGLDWESRHDALSIEMAFIRGGGKLVVSNRIFGEGLFHHYREMQTLLWCNDDHHRWSDLMLQTICENRITVIQGPRDCSKTWTTAKFALCDYWCFPDNTLSLVSSTRQRDLEVRAWGNIKKLFLSATERYPWLPGNVADSKYGIFTDNLDDKGDVRVMDRGLICIPCIGSDDQWEGMSRFQGIKQQRRRLYGDECFPAGTMVDTPAGPVRIETINAGDTVIGAMGVGRVARTMQRWTNELVKIRTKDGRTIICTPEHRFFTSSGWEKACELHEGQYMLTAHETMRILRNRFHTKESTSAFLQSVLRLEARPQPARNESLLLSGVEEISRRESQSRQAAGRADADKQPNAQSGQLHQGRHENTSYGLPPNRTRWKWYRTHQSGMAVDEDVSRGRLELWCKDWQMERERLSARLQNGHRFPCNKVGDRGRWGQPQQPNTSRSGRKERHFLEGAWVDSVEVLKQTDPRFQDSGENLGRCRVYNLEVEGHPSYSVEGLVVHNCQFMPPVYVNVLDALDKGDFKGVFLGNPIGGNGKALDKLAEPVAGWSSLGEVTKTATWPNKYEGITINLVGIDSPNFDEATRNKFSYLINQADADRVAARNGKDSAQFWTLIMGVRKTGVDMYRVLTTEMCERNGAFDPVIWSGAPRTLIYAIDAGFGGDPCISILAEFGEDAKGQQVIKFNPPTMIPVNVSAPDTPEIQISLYAKADCQRLGVPDANVFFDAGMRATLASDMARIMSSQVNAVNFGGTATDRPVAADLFVWDETSKTRRLKKCIEHYSKFVTELWYSMREVVEGKQAREMPRSVTDEFGMREWTYVPGPLGQRIELETKADCKERMGASPNKADAAAIALEGARRLGFVIARMPDPDAPKPDGDVWLEREIRQHRDKMKKRELKFA